MLDNNKMKSKSDLEIYMDDGKSSCYGKKAFFDKRTSDRCFRRILRESNLEREIIKLFGRECKMHRMTTYYGDEGTIFRYSGKTGNPNPWTKTTSEIRDILNEEFGLRLNFAVVSLYADGNDDIGWHGDKLRDMEETTIVSVNFGATRDFCIKPRKKPIGSKPVSSYYKENDKGRPDCTITIPLSHGDVAIMDGDMQSTWLHSVPKRKNVQPIVIKRYGKTIERLNMTFRVIKVRN